MAEKHTPNFEGPIRGVTWLEPQQCKDCFFRDKTAVELNGVRKECGWSKDFCHMFEYPYSKPNEVMHNTGECDYYEKET